ncbi:hypothetical protein C5F48_23560 [Cereibacter changlensis JA139]|uniref:DUF7713 domain-containing protein n=3 Tax=Cereibacter changlensis TaxID=402884 RepID=A0A2T4JLC4_9RHOB|nr:hypothetical protein C5F48_23560 [Cereibacter changlensis JA139]
MQLTIGPQVAGMTDAQILAMANDVIEAQDHLLAGSAVHPIEVPLGRPQIRWLDDLQCWITRGQVLRCHLSDNEQRGLVVWIDDEKLDVDAFARLLVSYAGWGMRITFVDESEVCEPPDVIIQDPED